MPAGRPSLLTPEIIEDVRRLLPTVMYLESVGDYLGIGRVTWRMWLKRGAREAKRLQNPRAKPKESEKLYLEFLNTYKKALAEGELYDLGVIKKASAEQWQAAAWRAERRFPKRWGKRDHLKHSGNLGLTIQTVEGVDEDEILGRKSTDEAEPPAQSQPAHPLPSEGAGT